MSGVRFTPQVLPPYTSWFLDPPSHVLPKPDSFLTFSIPANYSSSSRAHFSQSGTTPPLITASVPSLKPFYNKRFIFPSKNLETKSIYAFSFHIQGYSYSNARLISHFIILHLIRKTSAVTRADSQFLLPLFFVILLLSPYNIPGVTWRFFYIEFQVP